MSIPRLPHFVPFLLGLHALLTIASSAGAQTIKVYDSAGSTQTTSNLVRESGGYSSSLPEANAHFFALADAYNYFNTHHGHTSYDDGNAVINAHINWGATPHAKWETTSSYLHSAGTYTSAADLVGREYAAAVIENKWNHNTTGETAAIAAAIADLYGEFIDWSNTSDGDTTADRWKIGETLSGGPVRTLDDPASYLDPAHYGSSIGSVFLSLLVDGGTFQDDVVTGRGEIVVRKLVWQALQTLPSNATYYNLSEHLYQAASADYTSSSTPTLVQVQASVKQAALATDIWDVQASLGSNKSTQTDGVLVYLGSILAPSGSTSHGSFHAKDIHFKAYIPDANTPDPYDTSSNPRTTPAGFLDVIILCHGAGMNRHIATGWDDNEDGEVNEPESGTNDIDGLATYWARKGYIVVAPTFTKRLFNNGPWWQKPRDINTFGRFVTDVTRAGLKPATLFSDRIRDLKFIREHLGTIMTAAGRGSAYQEGTSKVGIAGHSLGAVTTLLAAGARLQFQGKDIDLEQYNFNREFNPDTPERHGAFVQADAYLPLSGGFQGEEREYATIDPARPNMTGRDYIQGPMMVAVATKDMGALPGRFFEPVTKAVGINSRPAYGLAINGANHLTPITGFQFTHDGMLASWNSVWDLPSNLLHEWSTMDDWYVFQNLHQFVEEMWDTAFNYPGEKSEELVLQRKFREYTLAFWDAHLSGQYDQQGALAFLQQPASIHEGGPEDEVEEYFVSMPTQVFWVRDENDAPLVQFQDDGNILLLQGTLIPSQANIWWGTGTQDFVLLDDLGSITAKVDGDLGDLLIRGLAETVPDLTLSTSPEFAVQSSSDAPEEAQITVDTAGDLRLRGEAFDDSKL